MVETAAHLTDQVPPRVPYRQWVLSMPKRVRWHLREKPEVIAGLSRVFLRSVETTLRRRSPNAPPVASVEPVAFVHSFGSYLKWMQALEQALQDRFSSERGLSPM